VAKRNGNEREEVKCEPWASTEENFNGRFERKGSCRGGLLVGRKTYFLVAGVIFALVAVSHALRIYMEWPVTIANWSVPKSVSWIALIVAGGLALFAFRFITENGEH
jgi:hypothetical protein